MNGTFFHEGQTWPEGNYALPAKFDPLDMVDKHDVQFYFTDYVFKTMFESVIGQQFNVSLLLNDLIGINTTTGAVGLYIPEVLEKYGLNELVDIRGELIYIYE